MITIKTNNKILQTDKLIKLNENKIKENKEYNKKHKNLENKKIAKIKINNK